MFKLKDRKEVRKRLEEAKRRLDKALYENATNFVKSKKALDKFNGKKDKQVETV